MINFPVQSEEAEKDFVLIQHRNCYYANYTFWRVFLAIS